MPNKNSRRPSPKIMRLFKAIQAIVLTTIVIAISAIPVHLAAGLSSTPVYVLGVTNPQDPLILDLQNLTSSVTILSSLSGLSLVGTNSILFVDGNWLASANALFPTIVSMIDAKALAGVPTVTIRGSTTLVSSSITGLLAWHDANLPLISEGLRIVGTTPNGNKIFSMQQVVSGFDYAVQTEFSWANGLIAQGPSGIQPSIRRLVPATALPYWEFTGFLSFSTGDNFSPFGRVITTFKIYELQNSGSTQFVWFNLFLNQTVMPGIMVYNSNWRTSDVIQHEHDFNKTSTLIVDRGPSSLINSGPFTVSYNIGVYNGVFNSTITSTQSMSYNLKHTNVTDTSNIPTDASWEHSIDPRSSSGTLTFQVVPGATVRYLANANPAVQFSATITFIQLQGNNIVGTQPITYGMSPR
jgi:hypothetical protein